MVQAGEPLLELGDPGALELVVDVLTSDAIRIRPGAEVLVDRWGGEPLEGRVRLVEPSAFTRPSALGVEEQRVNVLVDLSSPRERWSTLGDGFRIEAHIVVWEAHEVLKVPASAVFRHGGSWAVFVVDDGVVHEVAVELGERTGREVQVVSGLQAGQRVVLHPSDRILSGAEVEQR
jgi:HlyD family secretion protein